MADSGKSRPVRGVLLVIEDDEIVAQALKQHLTHSDFLVLLSDNGAEALQIFSQRSVDLVLLDLGLPGMDGWQVLEALRTLSDVPVVILSGRGRESEKVRGLLGGADDYVVKPVSLPELLARVEAILRRRRREPRAPATNYDDGVVSLSYQSRAVAINGSPVHLTSLEFRLLALLTQNVGQIVSVTDILERVWGDPRGTSPGRVKLTVSRIRKKCGWPPSGPLRSSFGGYSYNAPRQVSLK